MKLASIIVAAALAFPAVSSFAQSSQSLTRAQVKADLTQVEKTGYYPGMNDTAYPTEILKAEAKVVEQNGENSYGGVADTSSASDAHTLVGAGVQPVDVGD
jgi:hypothetical protein